jgi:geranylgeranyl diphosphate synthase type II
MDVLVRIEQALEAAVASCEAGGCAPALAAAVRHAVFPGGARVRPRLCVAVGMGSGCTESWLFDAATAIELIHCASLVHDDLPCFDAAALRRGRPSVHRAFGERTAVLAGDALIVLAFQVVAGAVAASSPERVGPIITALARSAGAPAGIVSGQAWECEAVTPLSEYQRQKTGALFVAATSIGAIAAGVDPLPWRRLGDCLGEAYQVADDIRDVLGSTEELGKPAGRDASLGRPSSVAELGVAESVRRFESLVDAAVEAIPPCHGAAQLRALIRLEVRRLLPEKLMRQAA